MADGSDYREGLRTEMTALIDGLDLSPEQKRWWAGGWTSYCGWTAGPTGPGTVTTCCD